MPYTKKELAAIEEERDYWQELADHIGWSLAGWDRYAHASYRDPKNGEWHQIRGSFRDALVRAMKGR